MLAQPPDSTTSASKERTSQIQAIAIRMVGDPEKVGLEYRVLCGLLLLSGLTGIASTIMNLILGAAPWMVAATVVCGAAGLVGYLIARNTRHWRLLKTPLFIVFIGLLAFSWIAEAGSQGSIGYFFVLVVCYAIVLFEGVGRIISLATLLITLAALLVIEYYYPAAILPFASPGQRFGDLAFVIPFCLVMTAATIHVIHREYRRERAAREQALKLVTAEKERVERAMREKQRLLTVVSHDIANALTVVRGEVSLARFAQRSDHHAHALDLDRMDYACANIDEIISSVGLMEAMEQGRLPFHPEPVDLKAVFKTAEVIFRERLLQRRMRIVFPELADETRFVLAEPRILANQVFGNLFSNAIKFSRPDSTIAVTATRQENQTTVRVADHGIGIPPDLLAKLFDPEAKTSRPGTAGEPGTGFGLRTVKHFVELFGGQIEITSRAEGEHSDEHGTTVVIRLASADA
jgi:signal transduction histidine kinase